MSFNLPHRNMFNQEIPGTEAKWLKDGQKIDVFIPYLSLEILELLINKNHDPQITIYPQSDSKGERMTPKIVKLSEIELPTRK